MTTAVLDANVLYPAPLRDLLMHLALVNLYRPKWTNAIHDEWMRNVLKNRPDLEPRQLERTRKLMNAHVLDCLVTDYEGLTPTLALPDPDDRHVLAAAIKARADLIVTFNLGDFPERALSKYGVRVQHPDRFVHTFIEQDVEAVCTAVKRQREDLRKPPFTAEQLLNVFEKQGLVATTRALRTYRDAL